MNNKKNRRGLIVAVILVLTAAAAAAVFVFRSSILKRVSPERYMETVFLNTIKGLDREMLFLPDSSVIEQDPYEFSLSLGLKDCKIEALPEDYKYTLEALKLLTFTSNSKVDRKSRRLSNDISALAGGINITDFQTFFTDDMYAVRCETLTDKTITINPKTFVSDWNSSPFLVPLTNLTMPDLVNVDGLNEFIFSSKSIYKNSDETLFGQLKDSFANFIISGEVKYIGKENGYDIVEVKYSKENNDELFKLYMNTLFVVFEGRFASYLKLASGYGEAGGFLNEIMQLKNDLINLSFKEDITVTYYIDGKGLIRRLEAAEAEIGFPSGDMLARKIRVELRGEEFLSDIVDFEMELVTDGGEISIGASNVLRNSTADEIHHEFHAEIEDASGKASHTYLLNWTPYADSGAFDLKYGYDFNNTHDDTLNDKFEFNINGQLNAEEDAISFKNGLISAGYNGNSLELKAGYAIKKYDGDVIFDDSNAYSIFDINILELGAIFMKAQNFLYSF